MGCVNKWDPGGCGCGVNCGGVPCALPASNLHCSLVIAGVGSASGVLTYSLVGAQCQWVSGCLLVFNTRYQVNIYSTPACYAAFLHKTPTLAPNCTTFNGVDFFESPANCYDGTNGAMATNVGYTCSPLNVVYSGTIGGAAYTLTITP